MVRQCRICKKLDYKHPHLSFHRMPGDGATRKKWLQLLGFQEFTALPIRADICSEHFNQTDFDIKPSGKRYLKKDALPRAGQSTQQMSSSSSSAETPPPKRFKADLEPDQEVIIYDDNKEDIDFLKRETSSSSTASETQDEIIKILPGVDTETTADTVTGLQTSCKGILSVVVPKVQPSKKDTVLKQKKKIKILQQSVRRHWTRNISATSDPVTCRPCLNSLGTHGGFLKEYFNAQENYKSADNKSDMKSEKIKIKLEDDQDEQEKYESGEMPVYIKFEEIEIKEEEDRDGVPSSYDLDAETIENKKRRISEDVGVIKEEFKCETGFKENYGMLIDNNQLPKYEKS